MFREVNVSLKDMLGEEYLEGVIDAGCFFGAGNRETLDRLASTKVSFFPQEAQSRNQALAERIGSKVLTGYSEDNEGAPTNSYRKAFDKNAAPLGGHGAYRIGQDGRLYFVGKSEHYHASLGHNFGGFELIDRARSLGILNATHNNTRGYITRLLERELIRVANGIAPEDRQTLEAALASREEHVLNRVINLETGSLAAEAGIKMMLARFYTLDGANSENGGRIPVFFVIGDYAGGIEGNYHGTTIFAQSLRNMWPAFRGRAEEAGIYKVVPVTINDIGDFARKIEKYNQPPYKTAGFMHEIVLMNYGGILLEEEYLQKAYALCRQYDTPTMVDEIQSCVWYKELFLFKRYGLRPDFVIIGKGLGGGEYAASKVLTTAPMDNMSQFGALVTNGQEELASLAYLITMKFVQENGDLIEENQRYFTGCLQQLCREFPQTAKSVEGLGFLAALVFHKVEDAAAFAKACIAGCVDVSVQTYKKNCPPAVLMKLPLITSKQEIDRIVDIFRKVLKEAAG